MSWAADITQSRLDVFEAASWDEALAEAQKRRREAWGGETDPEGVVYLTDYVWPVSASYPAPYA